MSLESISALRQLTQVREQAATNQNENLEKVQGAVQQVSVSEAQRTDNLFLEKAKAEYEVELNQATVARIQSQLAREQTSLAVTAFITVVTVGLAVVDAGMNLAKDFKGGSKLGDPSGGDAKGLGTQEAESRTNGGDTFTFSGAKDPFTGEVDADLALRTGLIARNENTTTQNSSSNGNNEFKLTDAGRDAGISLDGNKIRSAGNTTIGTETVYRTQMGKNQGAQNESVQLSQSATFTQEDIRRAATGAGLDPSKINSFKDLMTANPSAASALFTSNGSVKNIRLSENQDYSNAVKSSLNKTLNDPIESGKQKLTTQRVKEITGSLDDKVEADNRAGKISTKDGAKYIFNALVSFAQTVVPQFQALMAAKDKVEKTEIELQAAIEKLAAARKKLSQIENIIQSVGGDGLGSGNNQSAAGLS